MRASPSDVKPNRGARSARAAHPYQWLSFSTTCLPGLVRDLPVADVGGASVVGGRRLSGDQGGGGGREGGAGASHDDRYNTSAGR